MIPRPSEHFLGVREGADPFSLLGLEPRPCPRDVIDQALERQLGRIYAHADRASSEADELRRRLRAAATLLRGTGNQERVLDALQRAAESGIPKPARAATTAAGRTRVRRPRTIHLTPFDRRVLAILVATGGWNRGSRARIVSLAASYGVSVDGLIKVITGLSDYAKSGGPQLRTADIAAGRDRLESRPDTIRPPEPDAMERLVVALDRKLSRAFAEDSAASRVRLSIAFGLITIAILVTIVAVLLRPPTPTPPTLAPPSQPAVVAPAPGGPGAAAAGADERPNVLRFPRPPTFASRGLPVEAIDAADGCAVLPSDLEDVQRRLSVSAEPSEAVYNLWDNAVRTVATAWALIDESTRLEIESKLREVLASADAPEVRNRLWTAFAPMAPHQVSAPLDLWRGSWLAGLLADLSQRASMPPPVVERARTQLGFVLPGGEAARADDFNNGARLWLSRAMPPLVATTELDERTYDVWELWMAAARRLDRSEDRQALLVEAVRAFLETPTDLARPGPSANVLGRLLQQVDFRSSEAARTRFLALFDDELIASDDLWVLTSLLVQLDAAPWFERDLVVPYDADLVYRRRSRDRIADRWPVIRPSEADAAAQGRGLVVDPEIITRWRRQLEAIESIRFAVQEETMMQQLVVASFLNEAAAAMGINDISAAIDVMDRIDALLEPDGRRPLIDQLARRSRRSGQAVGRDGVWSESYELVRGSREEMLAQIRQLRATSGTDLGPTDAATLVREAYRGGGQDIRSQAQEVILQSFGNGPNVVLELLDQLPSASQAESISDLIQQVTGAQLPRARDDAWQFEVRRALVRHALQLLAAYDTPTDRLAAVVAQSYVNRAAAARHDHAITTTFPTAEQAARDLAEALTERASQLMTTAPAPDDLPGIQRRDAMRLRQAVGPVQRFVATQLAVLELSTYIAVAERPASRDRAIEMLAESASRRGAAGHVLAQAVEAERAIARAWNLRFAENHDEP